jgi:hypothetical protein
MRTRGKVLRVPNGGPGLLMIEGQQFRFALEGWKSETPPRPGLMVFAELDRNLQVIGADVIPESQLAQEQAEVTVSKSKETGGEIVGKLVSRFGVPDLVAGGLLILGWFFFTFFAIQTPPFGTSDFSFWQLLGLVNASNFVEAIQRGANSTAGIYGVFALVALAGPFVHHFWNERRAVLCGLAPFVFTVIVWILARNAIQNAFGANLSGVYGAMAREAGAEALKDVSLGFGGYISLFVGLYFAAMAAKRFLALQRTAHTTSAAANQAAA